MKKSIFIVFILLGLLSINVLAQSTSKIKIATYVTGEIEPVYKKVIGNKLVSHITSSNKYTAVERSSEFQNIIGKEHNLQRSGIVDNQQIVELGKQMGVRYVIGVDASKVFDEIYLVIKQLDILTGEILNTVELSASVDNINSLQKLAIDACEYLLYDYNNVSFGRVVDEKIDFVLANPPDGYHMATIDEIKFLINAYSATGRKIVKTPVITNIKIGPANYVEGNTGVKIINYKIIHEDLNVEDGKMNIYVQISNGEAYYNSIEIEEKYYVYYIKNQ